MTAIFAYKNELMADGGVAPTITEDAGTWANSDNLGLRVLADAAKFTGASATISASAASSFSANVFGLLGLENVEPGATITFKDGVTTLGSVLWNPAAGERHAVIDLSSSSVLSKLTVEITDAGSGDHYIGGIWASSSLLIPMEKGWGLGQINAGQNRRIGGIDRRTDALNLHQQTIRIKTMDDNNGRAMLDALRTAGNSRPIIYIGRNDVGWRPYMLIYANIDDWNVQNISGPVNQFRLNLTEQR